MAGMVCLGALGCGNGKTYRELPTDPTYPVKGKVLLVDGRPAKNGHVIFNPQRKPGIQARGKIGSDGTFALSTRNDGDGALAGDYDVLVVIPPNRKELYRYAKYAIQEAPLLKVSVKSGTNDLQPFRLR